MLQVAPSNPTTRTLFIFIPFVLLINKHIECKFNTASKLITPKDYLSWSPTQILHERSVAIKSGFFLAGDEERIKMDSTYPINRRALYTKEFLLSKYFEGYEEYRKAGLSYIKRKQIEILNPQKTDFILDVGCGRGEVLLHCARRGAKVLGIDFSKDAIEISKQTLSRYKAYFIIADATRLPFKSNVVNKVILGDVIEHLIYKDGIKCVNEIFRVLRQEGKMLLHTSPNTFFTTYAYPVIRVFLKLLGKNKTVKEVDEQLSFIKKRRGHVNEQNPLSIRSLMKECNFKKYHIWLEKEILRGDNNRYTRELRSSLPMRLIARIASTQPLRYFFSNDIWVLGLKE